MNNLCKLHPELKYSYDDKGFGELFADIYKDKCRFNVSARSWYFYNGKFWELDREAMHAISAAKKLISALIRYASTIEDERTRAEYLKVLSKYGQRRYRDNMIADARDKYFIKNEDLDGNTDLFNCQNGTFNLKDCKLYPHSPNDLLSKISNVVYNENANAAVWSKFISEIMQNNEEKTEYLQKVLGYSLTAETTLETCWLLYGATSRNGKSTLVETIGFMFGDYAVSTQPQTLAVKQNKDTRQASGDIARLAGARFCNASEPPKRMLFDSALLKTLLGRDTITCRRLYESEFQFVPQFKLFINTNYLPLIQDDSVFASGRINVITFDRHFSEAEQKKDLKECLKQTDILSGVFNWCVDGLRQYRKDGAEPPACVVMATSDYRQNSDKIGLFISECLEKSNKNTAVGTVYNRYKEWCATYGYGIESRKNFTDELKNKGIYAKSGTVNGVTVYNVVVGYTV